MYTDNYLADIYHIAQNFDGGNFDVFDTFKLDHQNLTRQIVLKNTAFTGVWWKTVTIRQNIFRQIFEESLSVKISPRQNFALYGNLNHCLCINITQESELREATWRERLFDLIKFEDPLLPKIPPKFKIRHYLTAPFRLENKEK